MIPPTRADDETLRELAARMRFPRQRLADLRAQRRRQPGRRAAPRASSPSATGVERLRAGMEEILAYAERRTRAALAELPDGTYAAERRARGRRRRRPRDVDLRVAATIAGDAATLDFSGTDPAGRGQPQLPALGDQVGRLLRGAGADRPRRAALGGRLPADRGDRAGGLPAQRAPPAAVAAGNVETSSRVADLVIAALGGRAGRCPPRARGR